MTRRDRLGYPEQLVEEKVKNINFTVRLLTFLILSFNSGDFFAVQSDNIMASAWFYRKVVTMMAIGCDATKVGTVLRRQKDGSQKEVSTTTTFFQYNKYMGDEWFCAECKV